MKVCTHKGYVIAILSRNEHCPPHVHVNVDKWEARFEFSFWHNGVRLLDVIPAKNEPKAALLEELRQTIKHPSNLRRARELWWQTCGTLCLENQYWDGVAEEVVSPKSKRPETYLIQSASLNVQEYKTVLHLAGRDGPLEIEL